MALTVAIAPDSFKGSLDALAVALAIAEGWASVRGEDDLRILPQADGGEGTLVALAHYFPAARLVDAGWVTGPDGRPVRGRWLRLPDGGAVVELAEVSGLSLMRRHDATGATTRGLGEVIAHAVEAGAPILTIALGGSACTDAGLGALRALGLELYGADGSTIVDGGGALADVRTVDTSRLKRRPAGGVATLTDVTAPLLGPRGAAAVFAPQKGATPKQVAELENALRHVSTMLGGAPEAPGAGAAGGTAYGFQALWGARLESGALYVRRASGLDAMLPELDVIVTGEGQFDHQSTRGKVVGELLSLAAAAGVRTGVIAGQITMRPQGWSAALVDVAGSVKEARRDPTRWLRIAGAQAASALAG
ncbi:glycerate kinase family protein [Demequina aurantiaca]|uniref:glycerate kinase family protein n=1 Tax=Demequina aurantiaca TaxID=676200 RepID=UPI003D33DA75